MKLALLPIAFLMLFSGPGKQAMSAWPLWNHYVSVFVTPEGRVTDPDRDGMTTSEGQGYAMFFALVAGDNSAFDRLRLWTENNLGQGNLAEHLPAWSWGQSGDGSWHVLDQNSAADADLWIAYSLVEAGQLWQRPDYSKSGKALLFKIAQEEVVNLPGVGPVLMPGDQGFHNDAGTWIVNPSYMPLPLLVAAGGIAPAGPWTQMASALPEWLRQASPNGAAMDWVEFSSGRGFSPVGEPGNPYKSPGGSYDAIRVYLWAGMAAQETPGARLLIDLYAPVSRLMKTRAVPPESISPSGKASTADAPVGFSAALIPFLHSAGEQRAAVMQEHIVAGKFDRHTGLLGVPPRYYDQNLALFALGWQEQRFRFAPDGTLRVRWKK